MTCRETRSIYNRLELISQRGSKSYGKDFLLALLSHVSGGVFVVGDDERATCVVDWANSTLTTNGRQAGTVEPLALSK